MPQRLCRAIHTLPPPDRVLEPTMWRVDSARSSSGDCLVHLSSKIDPSERGSLHAAKQIS
jgi:hypothetical protein